MKIFIREIVYGNEKAYVGVKNDGERGKEAYAPEISEGQLAIAVL
jgi:hypothetical protein